MYRVQLQQFEGPMDLLLFFIRRDEIDIHNIPIAQITDEYLAYVRVMEDIDLDGVADFIYMAAVLINLKARTLLPSAKADEDGEAVDPRRELVERLLQYVRFKEAADQLRGREHARSERHTRGEASSDRADIKETHTADIDASVYDLMKALGRVLQVGDQEGREPTHEVEPLAYTVEDQQRYVLERVLNGEAIPFRALVRRQSKGFVIATFLAVLELARQHHVHLEIAADRTDFVVTQHDDPPSDHDDPGIVGGDGTMDVAF
jgi:segregation and condensation protein A